MRGAGWPQLQHPSTGSTGRPLWKAPWGPQAPDSERLHLRTRHREPPEEMWRLPPSPLRAPAVHTALLGPAVARRPAGGHQVRPCTIAPPGASVSPSERRTAGPPATPAGPASGLAEEGLGAVAGADRREEGIAQVAGSRRGRTLFTHFCFSVASTFAKTGLLTFGGLGRGGSLGRVWPGAWQAEVPPGAATRAGGWARPGRRRAPAPRTERVCGGSASRPQSSLATAAIGEAAPPLQDPPQARRGAQHGTRAS